MTEAEWLASKDPALMQEFLRAERGASRKKGGRRRLRLFACACAHGVSSLLRQPGSRLALDIAQRYADGQATAKDLASAFRQAQTAVRAEYPNYEALSEAHGQAASAVGYAADKRFDGGTRHSSVAHAALAASRAWALNLGAPIQGRKQKQRQAVHADWLRDIFGNPFRPVTLNRRWRTEDVVALARRIYDDRAFERLPILADALLDAGCDDEQVLAHCRGDGPHVRGCWVVDLILGYE